MGRPSRPLVAGVLGSVAVVAAGLLGMYLVDAGVVTEDEVAAFRAGTCPPCECDTDTDTDDTDTDTDQE